ncbi:MAG: TPM domain-containing protein [bacterium]|nr:TPM domain-containing protein [bacterium]
MKKRVFVLLLTLMLLVPLCALGALRMPEHRGTVTDDANVLSAQTVSDLNSYAQKLAEKADVNLHVALVHFLDGAEVQSYANTLFDLWELENDDLLLLGAAGEDSFAAVMGNDVQKVLGKTNAENLLFTSSEFSSFFRTQQYDAAIAAYCTALNELVHKQTGESIRMDGLFGQAAADPIQQVQQYGSALWSDVMQSISESSQDYLAHHEREEREENGLTAGGWIVLIVLIVIMTRQSKAQRRYGQRRRSGCLTWILGLFGLNIFIDFLRGRR